MSLKPQNAASPKEAQWTHETVSRFWNGIAQTQLFSYAFSKTGGRAFLVAFDHLLPKEGRILDFGAGNGDLAKLMCERGLHVACYEPSEELRKPIEENLSTVKGFLGCIDQGSDETFDLVVLTEVIEHILEEDLNATLTRLHSFVKPGGMIIVTTPNNENLELGKCLCPMCETLFHRWQHVRSFTSETIESLFSRFGFEPVVTHKIEFNEQFYLPHDTLWGTAKPGDRVPFYLYEIRNNRPSEAGSNNTLVYVGKRKE